MVMMEGSKKPLVDSKKWMICIGLTLAFWAFMTWILVPFIPENSPFGAGFTAIPIAGTFYLASVCFTATLVDEIRQKKA